MFSFGFNSFWNSMHGSRAVQELLNKPELEIDELLEEDGLLSELKTLNQRLMSFLLREENFKKLISYVIVEPDAEEAEVNRKKGYKFPFVCADVLSSDSQAIVSEFFKSQKDLNEDTAVHKAEEIEDEDEVNTDSPGLAKEESTETSTVKEDKSVQEGDKSTVADANCLPYIDFLFTFLDANEMNLTSAGYFAKIANNLFAKKPSELIAYLYEQRPVLLEKMANHISSKSIAEFLAKILTFESSILSSTEDEIYNTKRKDILKILIKKLDPKQELEEINNTAYLICEVLGKYNTMHCSQEILQNLLDKSTIDYFFDLLKTKDSTVCCAVGLILGNIFAYYILINTPKMQYSNEDFPEGEAPAQNGAPQQLELTEEIPLIAVFIENLDSIIQYIVNTSGKAFPSQYGVEVTPFGSARLKLVELIIIAMKANNQKIYAKLIEHGFLDGLLDLFARYEWNNMLHNQVEKIVTSIIDSDYHNLKASLFEKTKVLNFVMNTAKTMEYTMAGKHERKIRKGYIGQLTRIANRIAENKDPEILKYTEENEDWKDFVENQLAEINNKNNIHLGGKDPRGRNEEEEIDSHNQFSGMMQQFSHYFANKNQSQNDDDEDEDNDNDNDNDIDNDDQDNDNDDQDNDDQNNEDDYSQTIKYIHKSGGGFDGEDEEEDEEGHHTEPKSLFTNDESNHVIHHEKQDKDSDDEEEEKEKQVNDQSLNQYNLQNEQSKINALRNVKIEEYVLDPEYNSNSYWKRDSWHSAEDILAELGGQ